MPSRSKCLILGGKGFIGRAIAWEAHRREYEVLIVGKDNYSAMKGTSCDLLINANGNSKKFIARENPSLEFDMSVRSVHHSIQDFPANRYVFLSTMDVYPNVAEPSRNSESSSIDISQQTPYGFHKYLAEQLIRFYTGDWLIFRMAGFVGEGLWKNSIFDLLNNKPLRVHPDSEYQYLNTHDLASAVFTVIENQVTREIFNIAGQGVISLREIAAMIPRCELCASFNSLCCERYNMNINKIMQYLPMPSSRQTVSSFIQKWLSDLQTRHL
jgi:nucleoside-diphosphate-sugar epimerase